MVPSVCGPHGDETEIHLAHLPVHRVLWRTGPDKGEKLPEMIHYASVCLQWRNNKNNCLSFLPVQLYNFLGYLMDNFTPSSNERKFSVFHQQTVFFFHWSESLSLNCQLDLSSRKFDLTHLPRERGVSGRRVGEVLLLQEHRCARDLLRTSPHLPSDGGAGSRPGGGLQEQESGCTHLL